MGSNALADHLQRRLGMEFGDTTPDRSVTLEAVYCLGMCACAPAAMLDGEPVGRLTPARVDAMVEGAQRS
jgi:formate dehydrogenase subunit gamma